MIKTMNNDNENLPLPGSVIQDREIKLPISGRIKIGGLGAERQGRNGKYRMPEKYDFIKITTNDRDNSGNFAPDPAAIKVFGEQPTEIKVVFAYATPEENFQSQYALFIGKTRACYGDGCTAVRTKQNGSQEVIQCIPKQCPYFNGTDQKNKCKVNATLSVLLKVDRLGGRYIFKTTGKRSVDALWGSLQFIYRAAGGTLVGNEFTLKLQFEKTLTSEGKPTTIPVVKLEFVGEIKLLQNNAYKHLLSLKEAGLKLAQLDSNDIQHITHTETIPDGDELDQQEFYPENTPDSDDEQEIKPEPEPEPQTTTQQADPNLPPELDEPVIPVDDCPFTFGDDD